MARSLSLTRFESRFPHVAIAASAFKDILYGEKVFDTLKKPERILWAFLIALFILVWRAISPWFVKAVGRSLRSVVH
jgi:hypothetical protein